MTNKRTTTKINLLRTEGAKPASHSSKAGLPDGWARRTFIVKEEHLEKLEALSYWQRKPLKELMNEALEAFFFWQTIQERSILIFSASL